MLFFNCLIPYHNLLKTLKPRSQKERGFCFSFVATSQMAYNRHNYMKSIGYIVALYHEVKEHDVPDTYILRHVFPKHGIFMSYRKWMYIKNMRSNEYSAQLSLFA